VDLEAVVRRRRMCRDFRDDPVDPALVDQLLDLARRAPSAGHSQGWAFLVLDQREDVDAFWAHDADPAWLARPTHPGLLRAPVVVLPLASRGLYEERYAEEDKRSSGGPAGWQVPYWLVDTAFATMLLLLAAEDAGLGALLFALHADPAPFLAERGVPPGWEPLGAVALGWPADVRPAAASARRGRRPLEAVVRRGRW
jgi:nitroreductase